MSSSDIATIVRNDLDVDREANLLATAEEQVEWLKTIGYEFVDVYFKFFILALFGGVKPQS